MAQILERKARWCVRSCPGCVVSRPSHAKRFYITAAVRYGEGQWKDNGIQTSLTDVASRFFEEGATQSEEQETKKPLKINRDLLLHRAKTYRQKGIVSVRSRKRQTWFRRAESCYRRVLSMDPTDSRAYVGLGRLFDMEGRYDDARRVFEDGCAVAEGANAFLWTALGNLDVKQNRNEAARDNFKAAIAANRSHEAAWHALGMLEKEIGNYTAARDCWMKGIRYAKATPSPYFYQSLALLAADLEFFDQARHWFRKGTATVRGAESYVMWTAWASMEAKDGNRAMMQQLFKKSLQLNPNGRYAYLSWGRIEQKNGFIDSARKLFLTGHQKSPFDAALLQAIALLEAECGNVNEAREYFQKSIDVNSRHLYSWQAWGLFESRQGNYDRARDLFQRGVWASPDSKDAAYIFEAWGRMEENLGNLDVARTLFRYGIKVDPRNETVWNAWIQLEEGQGDYLRANDLRNYSLQERVEIALPKDFSTLAENVNVFEEFFAKFSDWMTQRHASSTR